MKKQLIVGLLCLFAACTPGGDYYPVKDSDVKFHAGEKVRIKIGFYSLCLGIVEDYHHHKRNDRPIVYGLKVHCGNLESQGEFEETSLEKYE